MTIKETVNRVGVTRTNYENNVKNGPEVSFYKDGSVAGITTYKDGKRNGPEIVYHPNGKIDYERHYKDDKKNGLEVVYDYDYSEGNPYYILWKDDQIMDEGAELEKELETAGLVTQKSTILDRLSKATEKVVRHSTNER